MALITELHRADLPGAAADGCAAPTPTTPQAAAPGRLSVPAQPGLAPPRQLDLLELQEQIAQDAEAAESGGVTGSAAARRRQRRLRQGDREPYGGLSFGWHFPAERRCAHYARRWFGDLLRATWPDQDAVDACELAFGEVVANAVVHGGGGAVRVEVRLDERGCYFEITDGEREIGFGAPGEAEQDAEAEAEVGAEAAAQVTGAGDADDSAGSDSAADAGDACAIDDIDGAATDTDTDHLAMPRRAGSLDESGRGLEMLGLLCDHWSVRAAAHGRGKTIGVTASSVSVH